MPSSSLHQAAVDLLSIPVFIVILPIFLLCSRHVWRSFGARRVKDENVSVKAGSFTAILVLWSRALYHAYGFGPDHLATQLLMVKTNFPSRSCRACFVVMSNLAVWFFFLFKRDLFTVRERSSAWSVKVMKKKDLYYQSTDLGTYLQVRTCWLDDIVETFIDENEDDSAKPVQIVVLGAGYDARSCRLGRGRRVAWFEADARGTQTAKRAALEESNIDASEVTFVSVDFNEPNGWVHALVKSGLDLTSRTLLVWEGVTMYLPRESVEATLRAVGENFSPGSKIAFNYLSSELVFARQNQKVTRDIGEAMCFGLPAPGLLSLGEEDNPARELVESQGLTLVEHLWDLDEATERYLPTYANGQLFGVGWRSTFAGHCVASV